MEHVYWLQGAQRFFSRLGKHADAVQIPFIFRIAAFCIALPFAVCIMLDLIAYGTSQVTLGHVKISLQATRPST